MGWKYEVEIYFSEREEWKTGYMGNSLFKAIRALVRTKKRLPGRAYRLVVR